jgi:hypothetical protein
MPVDKDNHEPGATARHLVRRRGHAALGTSLAGRPFVSLVATACDSDATPMLLLSDGQSWNLFADPRCHCCSRISPDIPIRWPGRGDAAGRAGGATIRERRPLAARHPRRVYSGFTDFHLYRVVVERGHLVAGFGGSLDEAPNCALATMRAHWPPPSWRSSAT